MSLTKAEKFVLVTGLGIGAEHYANKAAVRYTGYGYRRLLGTTAAITLPLYFGGIAVSYRIGGIDSVNMYRNVVSDIVTQDNVNLHTVAFTRNVQEGILKPVWSHMNRSTPEGSQWYPNQRDVPHY